jgi:hypothetical protein
LTARVLASAQALSVAAYVSENTGRKNMLADRLGAMANRSDTVVNGQRDVLVR